MRRRKPLSRRLAAELTLIREELEAAVARSSLRSVAREADMTPTGLKGVLDGSHPYGKTWDKLRVWYALPDKHQRELPASTVAGLLRQLMRAIPDRHWLEAQGRLLEAIKSIHRQFRVKPPGWMGEVRRQRSAGATQEITPRNGKMPSASRWR